MSDVQFSRNMIGLEDNRDQVLRISELVCEKDDVRFLRKCDMVLCVFYVLQTVLPVGVTLR